MHNPTVHEGDASKDAQRTSARLKHFLTPPFKGQGHYLITSIGKSLP